MPSIPDLIQNAQNEELKRELERDPSLADGKTEEGIPFLQLAAYCRNEGAVELIRGHKKELDLFEAATVGEAERVEAFLQEDPGRLNAFSTDGFTPLGLASFFDHRPLVRSLLDKGADPNLPSDNPMKVTPLHSACAISDQEIAELLLDKGADVNAKQMQSVTPLHSAAHNGDVKLAKLLIDHGAEVNARMDDGRTPLAMALEKGFEELEEMLRRLGGE